MSPPHVLENAGVRGLEPVVISSDGGRSPQLQYPWCPSWRAGELSTLRRSAPRLVLFGEASDEVAHGATKAQRVRGQGHA